MSWNATITTAGTALLAQWAQGGTLTITGAKAGTDRVSVAQMMAQTDVSGTAHALSLTGYGAVSGGVEYKVLLTPEASAYSAAQIGIFGKVGSGSVTLIALYQADSGEEIAVPSTSDMPDFAYSFAAVIAMDNTGTLSVTIDSTALVSQSQMAAAFAALGDPVTIPHGGTGATTANAGRQAFGAAATFYLTKATWADIYASLSTLALGETATFFSVSNPAVSSLLTGGKVTSTIKGVVSKINTTGTYDFQGNKGAGDSMYCWRITGLTSASETATVGTVYSYTGTAV